MMKKYTVPYFGCSVFITVILFFLLSWLLEPEGDSGLLIVMTILISLQISFVTGLILAKGRSRR
ncbi:hypothetical protein [Paenibacillus spongiae]|uniref:Uncharacterized protein n=1 Tax=Paenibacillus spongiae TaxID=2909671 RepID=A0ABY5S5Z1_9BACL|nr:hypothetical protein [Paenibacillus spongiae]UVI29000.1 hypothetical protein L1F29_26700 [Paenibacillus spongiae]